MTLRGNSLRPTQRTTDEERREDTRDFWLTSRLADFSSAGENSAAMSAGFSDEKPESFIGCYQVRVFIT